MRIALLHLTMNLFQRLLLLLCFVCLPLQGVSAHEHHGDVAVVQVVLAASTGEHRADDRSGAMVVAGTAHCEPAADPMRRGMRCHCTHGPCDDCCATLCGIHCCALPASFAFAPDLTGAVLPRPWPDAPRDGVILPPRLRPPIV